MSSIHFKHLISAIALGLTLASTAVSADTRYYPTSNATSLEVGQEEYLKSYTSLEGLEGVYVNLSFVDSASKKYKLTDMKSDLEAQVRSRLDKVGLRMLDAEEIKTTPGQPTLEFYPAYSGAEIEAIKAQSNTATDTVSGENHNSEHRSDDHNCCRSSTWASFKQSSAILRNPNKQYMFATWGSSEAIESCENRGAWTYDAVLKTIDLFTADYEKAQKETQLTLVSNATDVPASCGQSWLMNLTVFETNQTTINESVKSILNQLVATASVCDGYSYLIETHSDSRADAAYNKTLSEARAQSIKAYLVQNNMSPSRLRTVSYGESKPLVTGSSDKDHAINRRVIITPELSQGL